MQYITGIHALNLPCALNTDGDWRCSAIQWGSPTVAESDGSVYGIYGLEYNKLIPEHEGLYTVANHIRALLDMLVMRQYGYAQGMRDCYIGTDEYDTEIFNQVLKLRYLPYWNEIDEFMSKEYMFKWVNARGYSIR